MEYEANYWVSTPYRMYEDENLTSTEVRLLGIICGLTRQRGYCWASNEVLAKKIHKSSARTIQTALASLQKHGYIVVQNDQNMRKIYLSELCQGGAENCAILKEKKNNSKKRENTRAKKQQEDKLEFGRRGLVLLTKREYERLCTDAVSTQAVQDAVTALEAYIANGKGRKYKDHYLTLLNWLRRDHKLREQQDGRKDEFW